MPHDLMTQCEQKKLYLVNGKEVDRWVVVAADTLEGVAPDRIRCMHCFGAVRLHKQQVAHGPQDHVEHRSRQDSQGCRGGSYFQGTHTQSLQPVT